jgi:hypothetical protein
MRFGTLLAASAVALVACYPQLAQANVKVVTPTARSNADNLTMPLCGGAAVSGSPMLLAMGTTQLTVSIADGVGDNSLGCFQVSYLNATGGAIGQVYAQADDQAAAAARTVQIATNIPGQCQGGSLCTVHVRQLVNGAAGCTAGAPLSDGGTATFYSCGDFKVQQPQPQPDAAPPQDAATETDGAPVPTPTTTSTEPVIPVPETDGGGRIAALGPGDQQTNDCSVGLVGGPAASAAGLGIAIGAIVLGIRRRRSS